MVRVIDATPDRKARAICIAVEILKRINDLPSRSDRAGVSADTRTDNGRTAGGQLADIPGTAAGQGRTAGGQAASTRRSDVGE